MNNILVPTDFSECANHATDVAVLLAKISGAKVHLLTSLPLPYHWSAMPEKERAKYKMAQGDIRQAERLLEGKRKKHESISMEISWADSDLLKNISEYVYQYSIDLIVMGSHGVGGKNDLFIGSTTQKVVRAVHCPVLIIKNPLEKLDFKKVIFASDFQIEELPVFELFLDFIKMFSPEIHFVAIRSSAFQESEKSIKAAILPFKQLCDSLPYKAHVFKYFDVSGGIQVFAKKIGADLIAISNHQRHPLKRMLFGSNVELIVNYANAPVLTLDFEENKPDAVSKGKGAQLVDIIL
jgi:nucleotide-binding universal stress UspA family protein